MSRTQGDALIFELVASHLIILPKQRFKLQPYFIGNRYNINMGEKVSRNAETKYSKRFIKSIEELRFLNCRVWFDLCPHGHHVQDFDLS